MKKNVVLKLFKQFKKYHSMLGLPINENEFYVFINGVHAFSQILLKDYNNFDGKDVSGMVKRTIEKIDEARCVIFPFESNKITNGQLTKIFDDLMIGLTEQNPKTDFPVNIYKYIFFCGTMLGFNYMMKKGPFAFKILHEDILDIIRSDGNILVKRVDY